MSDAAHPSAQKYDLVTGAIFLGRIVSALRDCDWVDEDFHRLVYDKSSRPALREATQPWRETGGPPRILMIDVPQYPNRSGVYHLLLRLYGRNPHAPTLDDLDRSVAFDRLVTRFCDSDNLRQLLLVLSQRQRTMVLLCFGIADGQVRSDEEAADYMRTSAHTLNNQLDRALSKLSGLWIAEELAALQAEYIEELVAHGETSIETLMLSKELVRRLRNYGIHFVSRLTALTEHELLELSDGFRFHLDEIKLALDERQLRLRPEDDQQ